MKRRHKFSEIYQTMRDLWMISRDPEERHGLEDLAAKARSISILFYCITCSDVILFMIPVATTWLQYQMAVNKTEITRIHLLDLW